MSEKIETYQQLFEASPDAILVVNRLGMVLEASAAAARLFQIEGDEVRGLSAWKLLFLDDKVNARDDFTTLQKRRRIESSVTCKDGRSCLLEITSAPVDYLGEPVLLLHIRDISHRRHVQEELREAKDSAEASNVDLIKINTELERATLLANELAMKAELSSVAKSEFLANMSHEIRTPMNAVIGTSELLLDTELSEEQREYTETIQRSADSLLGIINDILDYSKIEAGKLDIEVRPFDMRRAVEEVVELLNERAERDQIQLFMRYAPDAPYRLTGDPGRIRQILTNLAGNAIKFTNEGSVFINVEKLSELDHQVTLRVTVEDTGIGISEGQLRDIFDRFTQADASSSRQYGGTGLGLSIAKKLVELMGGSINATSEVDRGSTFAFTLPLFLDMQSQDEPRPSCSIAGKSLLVVDNSKLHRDILVELTQSWGVKSRSVATADEAFFAISDSDGGGHSDEIILVDYNVFDDEGEKLAHFIQSDIELCERVVLMVTARARRRDADRLKELGRLIYLSKPVTQLQLKRAIESVDERRRVLAQADADPREKPLKVTIVAERVDALTGMRVLLVEDNKDNQRLAVRMLEGFGCSVDVAQNGNEALNLVKKRWSYDLVLMDCQMPEMDGFEATAQIRHHECGKRRIPIIALTANAMDEDRKRCLSVGMDDFLTKPVKKAKLLECLEYWMKKASDDSSDSGEVGSDSRP